MKIPSLFLVALGLLPSALRPRRCSRLACVEVMWKPTAPSGPYNRDSPEVAKMEAHAHQNSAKTSAKGPEMEAKSAQKLVGFAQAKANGQIQYK